MNEISESLKNKCAGYFRVERFIEGFRLLGIEDQDEFEPILYKVNSKFEMERMSLMQAIAEENGDLDRNLIPKFFGFLFATGMAEYLLFITKGILFEEKNGHIGKSNSGKEYMLGLLIDCDGIRYDMFTPQNYCAELVDRFDHDLFSLCDTPRSDNIDPPTKDVKSVSEDGALWCHESKKGIITLANFDIAKETIRVAENLTASKSWD